MKLKLFLTVVVCAFAFSINACEKTSNTPLSQQYETGALQWKIARKEIDPNTLIHQAILENSSEVICFLIKHGVNVDYPNMNGMSPLTVALLNGSKDAVKLLLANGANPNPSVKWNNMGLLELALTLHDFDSSILLVEHNADVNAKISTKTRYSTVLSTALMLTLTSHQKWQQLATLMIEKGANICSDDYFDCPLRTAIAIAYSHKDKTFLEFLLRKGANINQVLKTSVHDYTTPLILAIEEFGDLSSIKFLVESGAKPNVSIQRFGVGTITPMSVALQQNKPQIIQYLLQLGARA